MIQINILTHNPSRIEYTLKSLEYLKKIRKENKTEIKIVIHHSYDKNFWTKIANDLITNDIETIVVYTQNTSSNYLDKIRKCLETSCEYSCSMDDDIFISNYLWDYIIENISILDSEENLLLTPLLSNGIPTVDLFIEDYFNDTDKEDINKIFKNTFINNYWDVDYSSLNKNRDKWDLSYYDDVKKINHHYKGIHPVRISYDAHYKIADLICNDFDKLLSKNDFYIERYKFPYFCNSFFLIKSTIWRKILNREELYKDIYDEVPLNLYMEENNLNLCFIRNGFSIHMAYNTIGIDQQRKIENFYIENLIKKI